MGEGGQRLAMSPLQNDEDPTPRDGWEVSSRRWNSFHYYSLLAARFPLGWFPAGPGGGGGRSLLGPKSSIYRFVMSSRCYA